ncbi:MAG: DUF92 domain-containing protein [Candidatus Altiarchaeota archaeon]
MDLFTYIVVIFLATFILIYAYIKKKIDLSAVFASTIIGLIVVFTIEISYLLLMISFFILGNLATIYKQKIKESEGVSEGVRTFKNVFGNGAAATIFSIFYYITKAQIFQIAFIGAMATATSDTFATEIGQAHEKNPKLITNLKKVKVGTPGAISLQGIFAAIIGSFLISLISFIFSNEKSFLMYGTLSGIIGCMIDSLIGATIERNLIDKHMTNFIATLLGGIFSIVFFYFLPFNF